MARKHSTKRAKKAVDQYFGQLLWIEQCIRGKQKPEDEQQHYCKGKSVDYFLGLIAGVRSVVENILMDENSYYGFYYVDGAGYEIISEDDKSIQEHPEYRDHRIMFITK